MLRRLASSLLLVVMACRTEAPPALEQVEAPALDHLDARTRELVEASWQRIEAAATSGGTSLGAAHGEMGRVLHALGRFQSAASCYRNARVLQPNEPKWPYLLAQVELREGRLEPAAEAFARVLELRPDHAPALIVLARIHREQGRPEDAERLCRRLLELRQQLAPAHFILGQIAGDRGAFDEAVEHYLETLEIDPAATKIHMPLSIAYRVLGREEQALHHLGLRGEGVVSLVDPWMSELQSLRPGHVESQQATAAFESGDFATAAHLFAAALAARPDDTQLTLNLGASLFRLGRLEEAEERYQDALAENPNSVLAHFNLGVLRQAAGRSAEAKARYRSTLEIDASHRGARQNLANLLLAEESYAEAAAQYRDLMRRYPGEPGARQGLLTSLARSGSWGEASDLAEESHTLFPEHEGFRLGLARLLAACPDEALRDGERALSLVEPVTRRSGDARHFEVLAMALAEAGRWQEAVQIQSRVVDVFRRSEQADELGRLEAHLEGYRREQACREPFPSPSSTARPGLRTTK